jgi:hypothetical protein
VRKSAAIVLAVLILATGCVSVGRSLVISGESLKAIGNEFLLVADVYVKGCADKTITLEQCEAFRDFGQKFQKAYPLAVDLWGVARSADDVATIKKTEDVIRSLAAGLSSFAIQVLTVGGK